MSIGRPRMARCPFPLTNAYVVGLRVFYNLLSCLRCFCSDPVKTFSPAAVSPHAAAAYGHAYGTPMYAGYAPHPHAAAAAAARYNAMSPVPGHPHAHHPHAHHPASPYAQHAAHLRHGLASPMHRVNSYPRYDAMGCVAWNALCCFMPMDV